MVITPTQIHKITTRWIFFFLSFSPPPDKSMVRFLLISGQFRVFASAGAILGRAHREWA